MPSYHVVKMDSKIFIRAFSLYYNALPVFYSSEAVQFWCAFLYTLLQWDILLKKLQGLMLSVFISYFYF